MLSVVLYAPHLGRDVRPLQAAIPDLSVLIGLPTPKGEGVYLPPGQFESAFVSLAHTEADIDETVRAAGVALRLLKSV